MMGSFLHAIIFLGKIKMKYIELIFPNHMKKKKFSANMSSSAVIYNKGHFELIFPFLYTQANLSVRFSVVYEPLPEMFENSFRPTKDYFLFYS